MMLIIKNETMRYKSKKCKEGINMRISENEYKIMQLLWDEGRPLTRAEILKGTEGRNWNPASIHLILNAMISKGIIRIADEEKKYGRAYEACYGQDEYVMEALKEVLPGKTERELMISVLDAFTNKDGKPSKKALNSVQKYIEEKSAIMSGKKSGKD